MKTLQSLCILVLVLVIVQDEMLLQVHAGSTAYSKDINQCLFSNWPTGTNAVLKSPVSCAGEQLCYSVSGSNPALFAVCYNTATRIPEFAASVVKANVASGGGRSNNWHNENGSNAPATQSTVQDYLCTAQNGLYPNWDIQKQQICSRGHLVANADFSAATEKELTFINTNIAPQWQPFNGGNWAKVEEAVRNYATSVSRDVYVVTGTGGQAKRSDNNQDIRLASGTVVAPKYYWKAVCDPVAQASIVFVGENSVGEISEDQVQGCSGKMQKKKRGVVYCYSLQGAETTYTAEGFKLPPFGDNCNPSTKGTFMDSFLNGLA